MKNETEKFVSLTQLLFHELNLPSTVVCYKSGFAIEKHGDAIFDALYNQLRTSTVPRLVYIAVA